jgi:uncharacterized protein
MMPGRRFFIDTAFVQALFNRADKFHDRAREWMQTIGVTSESWTTEAVLVEIGNALSGINRSAAAAFIRQAYQSPNLNVVTVDTRLMNKALELYERHSDKIWGLTDCISFVVMTENGLTDALTLDHHFEQAGFVALMKQPP